MTDSTPVMVVTGGSRGIGAATARLAAEKGYDVALTYLNDTDAARSVCSHIETCGRRALAFKADVSVDSDVERLFQSVTSEFGRLDVLVNNAGIIRPRARLDQMDSARWSKILSVNVIGVFLCARQAVVRMSAKHGGSGGAIINVSSIASRLGSPNEFIDYAASKGAVDALTIGLAKEVAAEGIRVNAVRPGLIYTDIHRDAGAPERIEELKGAVPMQRGGTPEEVGHAILWLAGPEASYVTGTFIDVGGGR